MSQHCLYWYLKRRNNVTLGYVSAGVVARLTEQLIPTSVIRSSNPFFCHKNFLQLSYFKRATLVEKIMIGGFTEGIFLEDFSLKIFL